MRRKNNHKRCLMKITQWDIAYWFIRTLFNIHSTMSHHIKETVKTKIYDT